MTKANDQIAVRGDVSENLKPIVAEVRDRYKRNVYDFTRDADEYRSVEADLPIDLVPLLLQDVVISIVDAKKNVEPATCEDEYF